MDCEGGAALHSITGFDGKYKVFQGQELLPWWNDDAQLVRELDLDQLMDWLRDSNVVIVLLREVVPRRHLDVHGKKVERVLFDHSQKINASAL